MMERAEPEVDDRTTRFALGLARVFGDRAKALAAEQTAAGCGEAARSWKKVGAALAALEDANAHMEQALRLLDSIDELAASVHLDHAIARLGLRRSGPGGS